MPNDSSKKNWRTTELTPAQIAVLVAALVLLLAYMAWSDKRSSRHSEPEERPIETVPAATAQLGRGDRHAHLENLVAGLSPLFLRYEEIGPASVNLYLDGSGWNSMTPDQQQQLMDEMATKQITRDIGATLHLYVSHTEVGPIGPGWTGEWKFRRND